MRKAGGSARRAAVERLRASVGGKVDAFSFAFGEADLVAIVDLPDAPAAAGVALVVAANGKAKMKTTVLLTAEEMDGAMGVVGDYRPPGS